MTNNFSCIVKSTLALVIKTSQPQAPVCQSSADCVQMENMHHQSISALWALTFSPHLPYIPASSFLCRAVTATTELFLPVIDQADDSSIASSTSSSLRIYLCCSVLHLPSLFLSPLTPPFSFFLSLSQCFSPSFCLLFRSLNVICGFQQLLHSDTPSASVCVCVYEPS